MNVTHGPSPKALHTIKLMLTRKNRTMNIGFTCCWPPLLAQNYFLCDISFDRMRGISRFDKCCAYCIFRPFYLPFPLPGTLFLQISTSSPPTSLDICSNIFSSDRSFLSSLL